MVYSFAQTCHKMYNMFKSSMVVANSLRLAYNPNYPVEWNIEKDKKESDLLEQDPELARKVNIISYRGVLLC